MNYIITWIIVQMGIGSCPDRVKQNEFGITGSFYVSCAVLHMEKIKEPKQKEFESKKEAFLFLDKLKNYSKNYNESTLNVVLGRVEIIDIKIDSLKIR